MILTKKYPFSIPAGASYNLPVVGTFFKILASTGQVNVSGTGFQLEGISTGQGVENVNFQSLLFTDVGGLGCTITVIVGDVDFIDSLNGTVAISETTFPVISPVFAAKTITNASTALVAASTTRQYMMVQNNSATGTIYVTTQATATTGNGIKLGPGESWEMPFGTPGAWKAIGDIASNANVMVVEG